MPLKSIGLISLPAGLTVCYGLCNPQEKKSTLGQILPTCTSQLDAILHGWSLCITSTMHLLRAYTVQCAKKKKKSFLARCGPDNLKKARFLGAGANLLKGKVFIPVSAMQWLPSWMCFIYQTCFNCPLKSIRLWVGSMQKGMLWRKCFRSEKWPASPLSGVASALAQRSPERDRKMRRADCRTRGGLNINVPSQPPPLVQPHAGVCCHTVCGTRA